MTFEKDLEDVDAIFTREDLKNQIKLKWNQKYRM